MKEPFLYQGGLPILGNAELVISVVKTITATGGEEAFLAACREKNIVVQATLYREASPTGIEAATLFIFIKMILETGREAMFRTAFEEFGAAVAASPELVNLVKQHLFARRQQNRNVWADEIIRSATCPRDQ